MTIGYTSLCSWVVVEPAIEVLSVCLPAMAPFLQVRKVLADLRTSLRSLLSLQRSSKADSRHTFHQMDKYNENFIPDKKERRLRAVASQDNSASTHLPLQSIMVRRNLEQQ